jgi:hypothetical protein
MTTLKGILGVIRTNKDFRDLSGQYHLIGNVSTLLEKNFAVPLMFVVHGYKEGSLQIQAEWYVDDKKKIFDYNILDGYTALKFINHSEPSAIRITESFDYCRPGSLQCSEFNSRVTLDNYQIKLLVGGPVGTIVYAKK